MTVTKILIVDDEQLIRMAMARTLNGAGHEVSLAAVSAEMGHDVADAHVRGAR